MSIRLHAMTCGYLTMPLGFLVGGLEGMVSAPIPSYLVEHPRGSLIFDTGLQKSLQGSDPARLKGLGPLEAHATVEFQPGEELAARLLAAGHDPARIGYLVNSHLHFDHVGGNAQIPNARWLIQKREWAAGCTPECQERNHYTPSQFDLGHDRLEVDGEHDVFGDGSVVCIPSYGHTPGHQSLRLKLDGGEVVLTADACYMRQTLERMSLPPGFLDSPEDMLATLRRFKAFQAAGVHLIFGHDPEQWRKLNNGPLREITAPLAAG